MSSHRPASHTCARGYSLMSSAQIVGKKPLRRCSDIALLPPRVIRFSPKFTAFVTCQWTNIISITSLLQLPIQPLLSQRFDFKHRLTISLCCPCPALERHLYSPHELCAVTNFDLTLTQQTQLALNPNLRPSASGNSLASVCHYITSEAAHGPFAQPSTTASVPHPTA